MSWVPGFTAPPKGGSPRMGSPSEWNMHAKHAYACICIHLHEYMHLHIHMYICLHCVCMQAYTRMACLHLHMLAWHACIHASLMPCAPPPHIHRGWGGISPWVGPIRSISCGHLHCPPTSHMGGGSITVTTPYPLVVGRGTAGTRTHIYIYIYIHICMYMHDLWARLFNCLVCSESFSLVITEASKLG